MLRKAILTYLLLLALFQLKGQDLIQGNLNNYTKAPELDALRKFGNIPVSFYTGTPDIKIPIYEVNSKDISFPITINYHSGGIKVDEEASRVGLGWNIACGGVIYRKVRGQDDLYVRSSGAWKPYLTDTVPDFSTDAPLSYFYTGHEVDMIRQGKIRITPYIIEQSSAYDFQPDEFSYSLPNTGGKFVINRKGEALQDKIDNTKIELLLDTQDYLNTKWVITTGDGYKYYFNDAEVILPKYGNGLVPFYISAWYLSKIVSPTGSEVTFTYNTDQLIQVPNVSNYYEQIDQYAYETASPIPDKCYTGQLNQIRKLPASDYKNKLLSTVDFSGGKLLFKYGARQDSKDKRLDKIQLVDQAGDTLNEFNFSYDYFRQNAGGYMPSFFENNDYSNLRLKLVSYTRQGGNDQEVFKFSYNESQLPPKYCLGRDHWGYFNGAVNNTSLIPEYLGYLQQLTGQVTVYYPGAERKANASYMQAFMLTKVEYPTGGSTSFEYEPNDFDLLKSNVNRDEYAWVKNSISYYRPVEGGQTKRDTFDVVLEDTEGNGYLHLDINVQALKDIGDPAQSYFKTGYLRLINVNTGYVYVDKELNDIRDYQSNGSAPTVSMSIPYALQPGRYQIAVYLDPTVDWIRNLTVEYKWMINGEKAARIEKRRIGGGVRIKKITNFDPVTGSTMAKGFYYGETINNEYHSFGRQMSYPRYTDIVTLRTGSFSNMSICQHFIRNAGSVMDLFTYDGIAVGYDTVFTVESSGADRHKTMYVYHNIPDDIYTYNNVKHPAGLANGTDPLNGHMKEQLQFYFDPSSSSYKIRGLTKYFYSTNQNFRRLALFIRPLVIDASASLTEEQRGYEMFFYPAMESAWVRLDSIEERIYDNANMFNSKVTRNIYEGGLPLNYLVKEQYVSTSDTNVERATKLIYSTDFLSFTGDKKANLALLMNMKNLPVEKLQMIKRNNQLYITDGEVYDFSLNNNGSRYSSFLEKVYTARIASPVPLSSFKIYSMGNKLDSSYELAKDYLFDYTTTNVKRITLNGTIVNSYLWGYNNLYPIAVCNNAKETDIFYSGFEDLEGNSTAGDCKTGSKSRLSGYSKTLSSLTNGEYILTYWLKNGGSWEFKMSKITVSTGNYTIALSGQIDDICFYPSKARIKHYTFRPLIGLTSITESSEKTAYYDYDKFGRLKVVRDQDGRVLKLYDHQYQKPITQ